MIDNHIQDANLVLQLNEVRLMMLDGVPTIGLWSDLDGPHIRAALRVFHPDEMPPIRYLDGRGIPDRYKGRRSKGETPPLDIVATMQAAVNEAPWEVRDRMLDDCEKLASRKRARDMNDQAGPDKEPKIEQGEAPLKEDPNHPGKHIDAKTGIWPISEWGSECARGFRR